ncbi:hypothetical protein HK102_004347 [Quaeritorhiza haematococci]|nr:hypothetical protein HK102_004347 [Quaeritorhiza haematococci]
MANSNLFNYIVAFAAALGGFLFGYEIGIIDQILGMEDFGLRFGLKEVNTTTLLIQKTKSEADIKGWVTSTFLMGCVLGAIIVSMMADGLGRKWSILIGGFMFAAGGLVQTLANAIAALYGGRVISGIGIGILSMVVPLYISETAPTEVRGRMIAVQQLMITIGIFIASCINSIILTQLSGDIEWRLAMGMQVIPGSLLVLIIIFMPYSPRWLMSRQRETEAVQILAKLRAQDVNSATVQTEFHDIKAGIELEKQVGNADWPELLKPGIINRVLIAFVLQTFQQWTGINVILYYAGDLFSRMGFGNANATVGFVIANSFINFISTFPGMYLIERVGRRKLLIWGGFGMGIAHFCVCLFTGLSKGGSVFLAWLAVFSVYTFIVFFSSTWGPVVWVYQSEIFPLRIRAKGTGVATVANWSWNAVIAKVTPLIIEHIDFYTYTIFGSMGIAMAVFTILFVPETMGKSLEDMDEIFGQGAKSPAARGSADVKEGEKA